MVSLLHSHLAGVLAIGDDDRAEGAGAQAVDRLECEKVIAVVSPASMPSLDSNRSSTWGLPRTWQAVPMHTCRQCLPFGFKLKAL